MITTHDLNLVFKEMQNMSSTNNNFEKYDINEIEGMYFLLTVGKYRLPIIKNEIRTYLYSGMDVKVLG